ncbi:MAG: hypothetical protein ACC658_05860 [Acidimicrobiia bacterium]
MTFGIGLVVMALIVVGCSSGPGEDRSSGPPIQLAKGDVACVVDYGDDPDLLVGPLAAGQTESVFTSDDTGFAVTRADDNVEVRAEEGTEWNVIGFGLLEASAGGITFLRDATADGGRVAYTVTCWRG